MRPNSKLMEGMWAGDLADLVQPLISVDEYQSKIDDSAVAIGFYVSDKDAAEDLNRFIQKSPISLIDCDVSPAPDQRGYYIVFVEMELNDRFVSNVTSLLDEIGPLTDIDNWQMRVRGNKGLIAYDQEKLGEMLKVNHVRDEIASLKQKIDQARKASQKKKLPKKAAVHKKDT